jgi:hypothetical protein
MPAVAAILLSALVLLGLPPAPAAEAKVSRAFFGVVTQSRLEAADLELMRTDGVGIVRQLFLWPAIEPSPGGYDWRETDAAVGQAAAVGIRIFPVLYGTPAWAQSAKMERRCGMTCAPRSPEAKRGFARFAGAAAARYGPGGTFWTDPPPPPPAGEPPPPDPCLIPPLVCKRATGDLPIAAWQIWNEQNSPTFFGPRPDPRRYAALLADAAKRIRREDRGAEVLLGGMWGPPGTKKVIPTQEYLQRLYRVRGVRSAFDSIAVHPYAGRFSSVVGQLRRIRKVVQRAGDGGVGTWVTELGWASGGPRGEALVKTPSQQAKLLRASFRLLLRKRKAWNVRSVHWYSWRDTATNAAICKWCPKSGLRTSDGGEKPSIRAFRKFAR